MQIYLKGNEGSKVAIETLKKGGIILLPTETVFGVGCVLTSYDKLVELKHRPENKAFPICVSNFEMINKLCTLSTFQQKALERLLPGPLTLVLPLKNGFKNKVTVAIRFSTDKYLNNIIAKVNEPIYLTSANLSGKEPFTSAVSAAKTFKDKVGCYIEGSVGYNQASTIVDLTNDNVKIIRQGPVSLEDILNKIGDLM